MARIFEQRRDAGDSSRPASATRASWQGPEETPGPARLPLRVDPKAGTREASCRVSWAQFRASKLPQIKADCALAAATRSLYIVTGRPGAPVGDADGRC